MMPARPLHLRLDRLRLIGLPPGGERRLREEIAQELERLLREGADRTRPGPRESVALRIARSIQAAAEKQHKA